MGNSIIYILLFILCLSGLICYPKTENRLNGVKLIIMGIMAIFCYQTLVAGIYSKFGIFIALNSVNISMLVANAILWGGIIKRKRFQKLSWPIYDIVSFVILSGIVIAISYHMFSYSLRLSYVNSDPANHFNSAMTIVKTGKILNIYFSAFIDAMFIEIFAPILSVAQYYKAFILADVFMHILEILMFYVLVCTISSRKITKSLAPMLSICYFGGYPAYSYMTGGFVYWSNGIMILMFVIYTIILLERYPMHFKGILLLLMLGCYANGICNKLFIPVNFFAISVTLILLLIRKKTFQISNKILIIIVAGICVSAIIIMTVFWNTWGGSIERILEYVSASGGIYRSMYADLVFFIPAVLITFYNVFFKREGSKIICEMNICMLICAIAMYVLWYYYYMSTYYYYKIYYNLWLFGWLSVVLALEFLAKNGQIINFFAYAGLMVLIGILSLSNYDYNMSQYNPDYNANYATKQLFSLYRFNMDSLLTNYEDYSIPKEVLEVFSYAVENYNDELIPITSTNTSWAFWFDAMMGQGTMEFYPENDFTTRLEKMRDYGVKKWFVIKNDDFYSTYREYIEKCIVIYENDKAMLVTYSGEGWLDILNMKPDYSMGKIELFSYVVNNLSTERVPLLADINAYFDVTVYKSMTVQDSSAFHTWEYDAEGNIENLNDNDVNYVVLLKDDEYYKANEEYFDSQEIVFENEMGMIVKHKGYKWNTAY